MTVRVLIVDDHEVIRDGLRALISVDDELELVGEAATVADAKQLLTTQSPDVLVLDVVLPDGDGIQLCRELELLSPTTSCILLTTFPERRAKLSAVLAGAAGYLPKDTPSADIGLAIHAAANGEPLISSDEIESVLDEFVADAPEHSGLAQLTPQERRTFELVGQGLSNRAIGEAMFLSDGTVKNYVSRMLAKLDMSRRTEAAVLATKISERRARRDAQREE